MEKQAFEDFLPVEAAGSGNASTDYRFIAASVRQQRLFARSMELRLGEYMGRYDNVRMLAVEGAYRDGDIERVSVLCCAVLGWAVSLVEACSVPLFPPLTPPYGHASVRFTARHLFLQYHEIPSFPAFRPFLAFRPILAFLHPIRFHAIQIHPFRSVPFLPFIPISPF